MIKAIILDDGYHSNDVVIKFGENYKSVSLVYFLNLLCKRHDSDYEVKTVHFEDIGDDAAAEWFEILNNMSYCSFTVQSCEEFEKLWESDEVVDGIDVY
nr:MAG TPA: hypothetical protein [Caudoviricetes sp.]